MAFFFPCEPFYKVPFLVCWAILKKVLEVAFYIIIPTALALLIIFVCAVLVCGLSERIFGWPDMREKPDRSNGKKAEERKAEEKEPDQQKESGVNPEGKDADEFRTLVRGGDLNEKKRLESELESLAAMIRVRRERLKTLDKQLKSDSPLQEEKSD